MSSLIVLAECLALGALFLAALYYFGFAVTLFLFPSSFRPWRTLAAPFAGIALIVVWDYVALFFQFNLTLATLALLAVVTGVNLALLVRTRSVWIRRRHDPLTPGPPPRKTGRGWGWGVKQPELWIGLLALLTFLVSIAPLVRYGLITIIGENWDYEFYLPLADYLKSFTMEQLQSAPSNPLLPVVTGKLVGRLPMGFSYLHSSLDILFGISAIDSYAILCALLHALGVVSAFLFFRATLKMKTGPALLASGLYAASGLLLWTTFWGFGLQLASLALLPLAVALGAHALMTRSARDIPLAALLLAALNVTFHPTLIAALLPLGVIGLYVLVTHPGRLRTLAIGAGLIGLGVLFSFPTLFRLRDFWREFYVLVRLGFGVREFIPTSDAFGFSLYTLRIIVGQSIPTPWLFDTATRIWDAVALLLELAAMALGVIALARVRHDEDRRAVWYLITFAYLVYVLILRLPFFRPYPYGFLKALTLIIFLLVALLAEGLFQLPDAISGVIARRHARRFQIALGAAFCVASVFTLGIMLEQYFKPEPAFFNADDLRIREVPQNLSQGAQVFLTDRVQAQKIPMGLVAYTLHDFTLCGKVETGYGEMDNATRAGECDYALLARGEDAAGRGYRDTALWSNDKFALYPRSPGLVYHQALNERIAAPDTLSLSLAADRVLTGTETVPSSTTMRDVNIALASFVTQTVTATLAGGRESLILTPGFAVLRIPHAQLPDRLTITARTAASAQAPDARPPGEDHLFVPWIDLLDGEDSKGVQLNAPTHATTIAPTDRLLVLCDSAGTATLDARCDIANPAGRTLRWDYVVRGTVKGSHEDQEFVRAGMSANPRRVLDIGAGASSGKLTLQFDGGTPEGFPMPRFEDGDYRAALELFQDDVLLAEIDLYNISISKDGAVAGKTVIDQPIEIIRVEG